MGSSRTGEDFVWYKASRSAKAKRGSKAWDYTLLFPTPQVTGKGCRVCCSGRGQLERVSTFIRFLLLLETASFIFFQGRNYIFYSFSVQKGTVLEH